MKSFILSQAATRKLLKFENGYYFHPSLYDWCNYLYMMVLELMHVNKNGPCVGLYYTNDMPSCTLLKPCSQSVNKIQNKIGLLRQHNKHHRTFCMEIVDIRLRLYRSNWICKRGLPWQWWYTKSTPYCVNDIPKRTINTNHCLSARYHFRLIYIPVYSLPDLLT